MTAPEPTADPAIDPGIGPGIEPGIEPAVLADAKRRHLVKEIVCEILEIDPSEVAPESHFLQDHGADSLHLLEILAALETAFNVVIDQSALPRMVSLNEIYAVLAESDGSDPLSERGVVAR